MNAMKHALSIANNARHIRSISVDDDAGLLFAVLESNAKDPGSYKGDILDRLVAAARARVPAGAIHAPDVLADAISEELRAVDQFRHEVGAVFYAGLTILRTSIVVWWAGDIRVHAVDAAGLVIHRTRDHNAIDDDPEGIYLEKMPDHRDFLRHVPTRALPVASSKPIERAEWAAAAVAALVICSSSVHEYRDPSTYVASLLDSFRNVPRGGFAAVIRIA
jgi:hypothetical protein